MGGGAQVTVWGVGSLKGVLSGVLMVLGSPKEEPKGAIETEVSAGL